MQDKTKPKTLKSVLLKIAGYLCLFICALHFGTGKAVAVLLTMITIHLTDGYHDINFLVTVTKRDLYALWFVFRYMVPRLLHTQKIPISQMVSITAKKFPNKQALIQAETGEHLTFAELEAYMNKVAKIFQKAGYKQGDQVALFMENSLEYSPILYGLLKIGVLVGLINCNLQGKSLEHSLTVINYKAIICSVNLKDHLKQIGFVDKPTIEIFTVGLNVNQESNKSNDLNFLVSEETCEDSPDFYVPGALDPVFYIYTSGSTGQPKAATVISKKVSMAYSNLCTIGRAVDDDIIYNCLPFYHSNGTLVGMSSMIYLGCTTVIRKKFSASNFFSDCQQYKVSMVIYIGELWRYLLTRPEMETERKHHIQKALGNGLRSNLVPLVKSRFGIKQIVEFYAATEGNFAFFNLENKDGVVGFLFTFFPFLNIGEIMRVDNNTGELLRDHNGRGIKCDPNEPGMAVGVIKGNSEFAGYQNNQKETNKKVARNVFREGDKVFLTGDLLVKDIYNNVCFVDRVGDTFRWKSENVATTEVENIMSALIPSVEHVIVYPVKVPAHEGNAGMAFICEKQKGSFTIEGVAAKLLEELPKYAIPMFIRVGSSINQTGTFKYQKSQLKKVGYDLNYCEEDERLFVYDVLKKDYVVMDRNTLDLIQNGEMRF